MEGFSGVLWGSEGLLCCLMDPLNRIFVNCFERSAWRKKLGTGMWASISSGASHMAITAVKGMQVEVGRIGRRGEGSNTLGFRGDLGPRGLPRGRAVCDAAIYPQGRPRRAGVALLAETGPACAVACFFSSGVAPMPCRSRHVACETPREALEAPPQGASRGPRGNPGRTYSGNRCECPRMRLGT